MAKGVVESLLALNPWAAALGPDAAREAQRTSEAFRAARHEASIARVASGQALRWGRAMADVEPQARASLPGRLIWEALSVTDVRDADVRGADLGGAALPGPFEARGARFSDAWFNHADFAAHADFTQAVFEGEAGFEAARFRGPALFARARFHGPGQFRAAQFEGAADFSEIEAKADWWMRSGVVFAQQADFSHARFHAAAGFGEARFAGRTDFKACAFGGGASFDSSTFTGDADFSECVFSGALWMDEAAFAGRVRFDLARLRGRVSMRDMRFTREDAARAASALQRQAGG